jgi:hypothetical protein
VERSEREREAERNRRCRKKEHKANVKQRTQENEKLMRGEIQSVWEERANTGERIEN